ncbi:proline reductase-associated electron transfer protein PrdC [Acetonema longum]|uniref:Respiratory-chain NADH dehydrogenase family protein n=1 Tax=Acetonema longum DSM 6540 TaxID=1009370 RepID=F7NMX9_9FIRM|nr:proline reductase-associated electron transfer protein PrdC [Acetonema longum]EGO62623.1 respiratory-chain NADH dehydrogenase family protein [Acetonema longum DSM 6540]
MKKLFRILLRQHVGNPSIPLVKIGNNIEQGELIASLNGLGSNLHASVCGRVAEVSGQAIVIEAYEEQQKNYKPLSRKGDLIDVIKDAGIVGMGGAGFPAHVKFAADLSGGLVIANGVECEPVLAHNVKQLTDHPELIYKGLLYAMQAVNANKGIFAVKGKNRRAVEALRDVIKDRDIAIAELPDIYPMGEERAIVREILGARLAPDQLPAAARAVVSNVETLARVAEAVDFNKPVISKHVTVAGRLKNGVEPQVFLDVPIGARIGDLIEAAGGIAGEYGEIIMGGPFTGKSVSLDDVITKTSGGILVTIPFPHESRKMGILVCACGASEARLREIADRMGSPVAGVEFCKQVVEIRGNLKCENPGNCPGQAEKVLKLKKSGAEVLLISNCTACSNTIMGIAPKMKLSVYHHTDHVLRTVNHSLVRRLKS